jgi:hypothetical protein
MSPERIPASTFLWTSEAELNRFWTTYSSGPSPEVDFRERSVVGVFLGPRPSAGYSVEITRVEITEDGESVHYRELLPNPERDYAAVITHPHDIVVVDRILLNPKFVGTQQVREN